MIDTSRIIDFLLKLSALGEKKTAMRIIYSAEKSANVAGLQNKDILKIMNEELKGNMLIDNIIRLLHQGKGPAPRSGARVYTDHVLKQISRGKPKSVAYRDILEQDVINMLKTAESKGVAVRDIFKTYTKMQPFIAKAESQMRSAMAKPTIVYVVVGILCYFIVNKFYSSFFHTIKGDLSTIGFIGHYYFFLVAAPIIALHVIIKQYPDRVPVWNKVYRYIKGAGYLLIIKTLFDCGINAADAIGFFSRLNDKNLHKGIDRLQKDQKDMSGLTEVLSPYLEVDEIALLKASVVATEQKRVLSDIVERRLIDIDAHVGVVTAGFSEVVTGLIVLPIGIAGYTINTILGLMTSLSATGR